MRSVKRKDSTKKKVLWSLLIMVIAALFASAFANPEMNQDDREFIVHTS